MMKTKLCILYRRTAFCKRQFAYLYAAFRSISIAWLNTLPVITFSEKPAFPRGAALRITELYAKMFQRLLRKAVESVCLSLLRLALREAKAVTSATRGGTPRSFSIFNRKQKSLAIEQDRIIKGTYSYLICLNTH